jgi:hypothetical protein
MSAPINTPDYMRFVKLAKLLRQYAKDGTISIYVEKDYASIELRGHGIPAVELATALEAQSATGTEVKSWY